MYPIFVQFLFITFIIFSPNPWAKESKSRFSRDDVIEMISSGNITSVEKMLEALAKAGKDEFFKNYVLMFHSRSLQKASFESPRVIMFSDEDEFVMAFDGEGKQMEMMEFDRDERAFKFFEVDFEKDPLQAVSLMNPSKCLDCHLRPDPRPNWDHYPFWAGMYGGFDDGYTRTIIELQERYGESFAQNPERIACVNHPPPFSNRAQITDCRGIFESKEGQEYIKFYQNRKHHLRYSHLDFNTVSQHRI